MEKIHNFDEVHDSQKMFRLILKAISNPLKKVNIKPYMDKLFGNDKDFLAIAFTLLDNETSFCTFNNSILDDNIISLTLSKKAECQDADFIFVDTKKDLFFSIKNAKCGTLYNPHKTATIFARINSFEDAYLKMSGAGIDKNIEILTDYLVLNAVDLRDEICFEYPQGIDIFFIDENGELFAIPRLSKKEN